MEERERIELLVSVLAGGNAKRFGEKAGICPQSVCCLRKGRYSLKGFVERILAAYPSVRAEWLTTGDGEPFVEDREKGEVLKRLENLEREVSRLADAVERILSSMDSSISVRRNTHNDGGYVHKKKM